MGVELLLLVSNMLKELIIVPYNFPPCDVFVTIFGVPKIN